jgi:hypothetical protein
MGEAKVGEEFVKHEFDEAIAIQRTIVQAEESLSQRHPLSSAKQAMKSSLTEDRRYLKELETMGKEHDATGKVEDVAGGMTTLMAKTLQKAMSEGADSDFYEAHAVLLNLKRKQMDSGGGMHKIAAALRDKKLRGSSLKFQRGQRASANELATELAAYAKQIAAAGMR